MVTIRPSPTISMHEKLTAASFKSMPESQY